MRAARRITLYMTGFLIGMILVCNEGDYWQINVLGLAIMGGCTWMAARVDRERRARGWKGSWYSG